MKKIVFLLAFALLGVAVFAVPAQSEESAAAPAAAPIELAPAAAPAEQAVTPAPAAEPAQAALTAEVAPAAPAAKPVQDAPVNAVVSEDNWVFVDGSALPGLPEDAGKIPVCGVNVGFLGCANEAPVYGVSCAVGYDGSKFVKGVQFAPVTGSKETHTSGLQLGLVNFAKTVCGLQLGLYNEAEDSTCQVGVLNHIKNGWLPYCLILNFN